MQVQISRYGQKPRSKRIEPEELYAAPRFITSQKLTVKQESVSICCRPVVENERDLFRIGWELWDHDQIAVQEHLCCLFLNALNMPLAWARVSVGGMLSAPVDPQIIMAHALLTGASGFCLYHNHPQELPGKFAQPSTADLEVTKWLWQIGEMMSIKLVDHIILTPTGGFYSFKCSDRNFGNY
jgi:DNA repair protein RadC